MTVEVGHPPPSLEVTVTLKDLDVLCKDGVIWQCKDDRMAGRTKGVRHTCPGPSKGRGEARYFTPKGTQGKGGVRRKSRTEG